MLFEIFCYAVAITATLAFFGSPANPATVAATEPQPETIEAPQPIEANPEPQPIAAMAATITEPVAVAVVKVEATPATEAPADLATLKTPQLRKLCSQRGITWRNALGANRHLPKAAMVEALLAS